jgi:tellurite resistance protein
MKTAVRIPPNFFGIGFGVAGLGETWLIMAGYGHAPREAAAALAALGALAWITVLVLYLRHCVSDRAALKRDLLDPVAGPFLSLAVITPMLLAVTGVAPYAPQLGKVIFDVFLVATFALAAFFTGQWIYGPLEVDKVHPGYFLPTVAGGLIASDGAALTGQARLAEVMFGLGMISWLVLGSIVLGRLFLRPMLPTPLLPTLAIEVAPAAVATLAYLDAHGNRVDAVVAFLGGYGLLMVLAQLRLLPAYLRLPFMPSTWAFTFSWAAVASAALRWLQDLRPAGHLAWQYVVLAAITVLIAGIAARTVVAVYRGQLLPAPPAPPAAPPAQPDPVPAPAQSQ